MAAPAAKPPLPPLRQGPPPPRPPAAQGGPPLPLEGPAASLLGEAAARLAGRPGEADVSSQEINIPPGLRRRLEALGYL